MNLFYKIGYIGNSSYLCSYLTVCILEILHALMLISETIKMSRGDKVLAGLAAQRVEGTLCDIELKSEHQTVPAHKAVLAASTPYFEAMFNGRFQETNARVVEVKEVTFAGLKNVVEYIYTANIEISADNIEDILSAAHLLQMTDIIEECNVWMCEKLTTINCFDFLRLAEKFNIEPVETTITNFVLQNFVAVSQTEVFGNVSQEALCHYMMSDFLKTGMEEFAVYRAAKNWILKNNITDKTVICDIMRNIRFALIPPITLSENILLDDIVDGNLGIFGAVDEAMKYHADVHNQPFYVGNLNKPRGKTGLFIASTGEQFSNKFSTNGDGKLDFLPFPHFSVATQSKSFDMTIVSETMQAININNFLFLFGARCNDYHSFSKRYDASNDIWMDLAPPPIPATIGSAIACSEDKKHIFLLGGMAVKASSEMDTDLRTLENVTASVCSYDVQNNVWSSCCDLPNGLIFLAAATLHNNVYITGGNHAYNITDDVYAYDINIKAKLWVTKAKMNHKRCGHALDVVCEKLYAMGGKNYEEDFIPPVEVYDVHSDQWTVAVHYGPDIGRATSLVIDNKIYIFCDYKQIRVSCYDVDEKKLTDLPEEVPHSYDSKVSAFMILPQLL